MKAFAINLAPGWLQFDLLGDIDEQIARFARSVWNNAPPATRARAEAAVKEGFGPLFTGLADGGAVAVILAAKPFDGLVVQPMAVVMPLNAPEGQTPLDLMVAVAASDPSATVVDLDDLVGLRVMSVADASERVRSGLTDAAAIVGATLVPDDDGRSFDDVAAADTRVRYFIGDPGDEERWVDVLMSVSHTSLPGSEELADASVELFDAMVSTLRWVS